MRANPSRAVPCANKTVQLQAAQAPPTPPAGWVTCTTTTTSSTSGSARHPPRSACSCSPPRAAACAACARLSTVKWLQPCRASWRRRARRRRRPWQSQPRPWSWRGCSWRWCGRAAARERRQGLDARTHAAKGCSVQVSPVGATDCDPRGKPSALPLTTPAGACPAAPCGAARQQAQQQATPAPNDDEDDDEDQLLEMAIHMLDGGSCPTVRCGTPITASGQACRRRRRHALAGAHCWRGVHRRYPAGEGCPRGVADSPSRSADSHSPSPMPCRLLFDHVRDEEEQHCARACADAWPGPRTAAPSPDAHIRGIERAAHLLLAGLHGPG